MRHGLFVQLDALEVSAAGHLGENFLHGAHGFHLHHLVVKVLKGEAVGFQLFLHLGGLFGIVSLFCLLDEGQHIAHAQNAAGHPVRMERLDVLQLLADTGELDGLACDCADGKRRAASRVAVQLGQHHGIDVQPLVEALSGVHRILSGHGVHDQHNFVWLDGGLDVFQLVHQSLVHMQTAGGVQKHHVMAVLTGVEDGLFRRLHRVLRSLFKHGNAQLFAADLQLLNGGGTVNVAGDQQRVLPLPLHQSGQLAAVGGFTRALQAHQHDHRRAVGVDVDMLGIAAHELAKLLVDDLHDHLGRSQGFQNVGADAALGDGFGKILDHLIADVRFQQRHANLPHSLLYVRLFQASLAAQFFEGRGNLFG